MAKLNVRTATIEDMLCAYVSPLDNDKDEYLVPAELADNNRVQVRRGFTPFGLANSQHPHTPLSLALEHSRPPTEPFAAHDFTLLFANSMKTGIGQNMLYKWLSNVDSAMSIRSTGVLNLL